MARAPFIDRIVQFTAYSSAAFCVAMDAAMSWQWVRDLITVQPDWLGNSIATGSTLVLASVCTSFGAYIYNPHAWDFLFETPAELADADTQAQENARIFGYGVKTLVFVGMLGVAYTVDILSTYGSMPENKPVINRLLLTSIYVFGSDLALVMGHGLGKIIIGTEKMDAEFRNRVSGFRKPPRSVEVESN